MVGQGYKKYGNSCHFGQQQQQRLVSPLIRHKHYKMLQIRQRKSVNRASEKANEGKLVWCPFLCFEKKTNKKTKYVVEWHLVLGIKCQAPSCIPKSGINYFSEVHFGCVSNCSANSYKSLWSDQATSDIII